MASANTWTCANCSVAFDKDSFYEALCPKCEESHHFCKECDKPKKKTELGQNGGLCNACSW